MGKALYAAGKLRCGYGLQQAAALAKYRVVYYTTHITNTYSADPIF